MSAGIYGWPLDDAVDVAVTVLRSAESSVRDARIVAFDDAMAARVERRLAAS